MPEPPEPPPFLRTWNRIYAAVLLNLALWVAALALATRGFQPTP